MTLAATNFYNLLMYYNTAPDIFAAAKNMAVALDWGSHGARLVNPYQISPRHVEADAAGSDGAIYLGDGTLDPVDLIMEVQMWDRSIPYPVYNRPLYTKQFWMDNITRFQLLLADPDLVGYMRVGLYDGAAYQYFRKYIRPMGSPGTMRKKMKMVVSEVLQVRWRVPDPFWYGDAVSTNITCTGGGVASYNMGGDVNGSLFTSRCLFQIIHTGAGTVDDPVVSILSSGGTEQFSLNGQLTTTGDYWLVDCQNGLVWKKVGATTSDDIANFSGVFPSLDPSFDLVTVTSDLTNTFDLNVWNCGKYYP